MLGVASFESVGTFTIKRVGFGLKQSYVNKDIKLWSESKRS